MFELDNEVGNRPKTKKNMVSAMFVAFQVLTVLLGIIAILQRPTTPEPCHESFHSLPTKPAFRSLLSSSIATAFHHVTSTRHLSATLQSHSPMSKHIYTYLKPFKYLTSTQNEDDYEPYDEGTDVDISSLALPLHIAVLVLIIIAAILSWLFAKACLAVFSNAARARKWAKMAMFFTIFYAISNALSFCLNPEYNQNLILYTSSAFLLCIGVFLIVYWIKNPSQLTVSSFYLSQGTLVTKRSSGLLLAYFLYILAFYVIMVTHLAIAGVLLWNYLEQQDVSLVHNHAVVGVEKHSYQENVECTDANAAAVACCLPNNEIKGAQLWLVIYLPAACAAIFWLGLTFWMSLLGATTDVVEEMHTGEDEAGQVDLAMGIWRKALGSNFGLFALAGLLSTIFYGPTCTLGLFATMDQNPQAASNVLTPVLLALSPLMFFVHMLLYSSVILNMLTSETTAEVFGGGQNRGLFPGIASAWKLLCDAPANMLGAFMVPYFTVSLFTSLCVIFVDVLVVGVVVGSVFLFFDGDYEDIPLGLANFRVILGILVPIFVSVIGLIIVTPVMQMATLSSYMLARCHAYLDGHKGAIDGEDRGGYVSLDGNED